MGREYAGLLLTAASATHLHDVLPAVLVANTVVILSAVAGAAAVAVGWWAIFGRAIKARRLEAEIQAEVAGGRYHRAVLHYIAHGKLREAAELEHKKGNLDRASELYERAGDVHASAKVYIDSGDHEMAALVYKAADLKLEAAEHFVEAGRADSAARLYEEVGEHARAAEQWRAMGQLERAAAALKRSGGGGASKAKDLAELAEAQGNVLEAAHHWEEAGNLDRAIDLYKQGQRPMHVARLLEARSDYAEAARVMMEAGEYAEAARLFERASMFKEAAHACFRSGDEQKTISLLEMIQDYVAMAGVYLKFSKPEDAMRTLERVPPEAEDYKRSQLMLAELYQRADKGKDAIIVWDRLYKWALKTKQATPEEARDWILQIADTYARYGKNQEAMGWLKRLAKHGLMTKEIQERLRALEGGMGGQISGVMMPSLERYEFMDKLGQGGNGVIYKARDKMLGRVLVIKMIGPTALSSQLARKWFLREAQTAAKLNHPNIVTIYDLGESGAQKLPYIAMELVDGETLAEIVDREGMLPMHPKKLQPIVKQLCDAMSYAHKAGVVHRDIKLENIMLTRQGDVKLMDFGLAKAISGSPDKSLVISGTPAYMSPEQIEGKDIDHRTDIYSLGVMLFLLLTGYWPFAEGDILYHHRMTPVPDPRTLNTKLPRGFTYLIERCMAKRAEERFPDTAEVYDAYEAVFGGTMH